MQLSHAMTYLTQQMDRSPLPPTPMHHFFMKQSLLIAAPLMVKIVLVLVSMVEMRRERVLVIVAVLLGIGLE